MRVPFQVKISKESIRVYRMFQYFTLAVLILFMSDLGPEMHLESRFQTMCRLSGSVAQ